MNKKRKTVHIRLCLALFALLLSPAALAAGKQIDSPGFVDGSIFVELAGDDAVTVEVSVHGGLLKAILGGDPELKKRVGGLESVHAVIVELEDKSIARRLVDEMRDTERKLLGRGWEMLARVKERDGEVRVLVLTDDEAIEGLVVLVADLEGGEMVFANIAGTIDLAALAQIGQSFNIPGLDDLKIEDDDEDDD